MNPRRLVAHYRMSRLPLAPLLFLVACNGARSKAESTATRTNEDASDTVAAAVDLAMIMGTGFPPFRGGLLRFADSFHLRAVLERAKDLHSEFGERFAPPPLLERLARENRSFYEAFGG